MDAEMVENPIAYPSDDILANMETFVNLPDEVNQQLDILWISVSVGSLTKGFWLVITVSAVSITAYCIYHMNIKKKRAAMRADKTL
jgi:hypothetical protein